MKTRVNWVRAALNAPDAKRVLKLEIYENAPSRLGQNENSGCLSSHRFDQLFDVNEVDRSFDVVAQNRQAHLLLQLFKYW
jgi:hypothetical protein